MTSSQHQRQQQQQQHLEHERRIKASTRRTRQPLLCQRNENPKKDKNDLQLFALERMLHFRSTAFNSIFYKCRWITAETTTTTTTTTMMTTCEVESKILNLATTTMVFKFLIASLEFIVLEMDNSWVMSPITRPSQSRDHHLTLSQAS